MRRYLPAILASLAPAVVGLLWAWTLQAGWLANLIFLGTYEFDLAALVSRAGLIMSLLLLSIFGVSWRLDAMARLEREIEQDQQEKANRRFLRRLDHELKNPLTIIRLGVVNLEQSAGLSAPQQASLRRVGQQVQRLQTLVEDLRWLTELEERGLERSAVPLGEVLEEARTAALEVPGRSGREVQLNLQQAPWPLGAVHGDRDLLILAFRNLLDNALKYTSPEQQVEVRGTDDGSQDVIEVADSGPGIPKEELPHIFDELYRGHQAKSVEGSGLGLTLVRKIIKLHGGEINVNSSPGRGTVVRVTLPLAAETRHTN